MKLTFLFMLKYNRHGRSNNIQQKDCRTKHKNEGNECKDTGSIKGEIVNFQ